MPMPPTALFAWGCAREAARPGDTGGSSMCRYVTRYGNMTAFVSIQRISAVIRIMVIHDDLSCFNQPCRSV